MILITLARVAIAAVFLMAGWTKARDTERFVRTIGKLEIVPTVLVRPLATTLPWAEIGVALFLFADFQTRFVAPVALTMLLAFSLASLLAIARNLNVTCDCFGVLYREPIGPRTLARDLVLICACASVAAFDGGDFGLLLIVTRWTGNVEIGVAVLTVAVFLASSRLAYRASGGFFVRPSKGAW